MVERTDNLAIINGKMLDEPPEAEEGETPGATLYLRVPASRSSGSRSPPLRKAIGQCLGHALH